MKVAWKWLKSRPERELLLLAAAIFVSFTMIVLLGFIRPSYLHWREGRQRLEELSLKHARFSHNLAQNDLIEKSKIELAHAPVQLASDQITLSEYLKSLEEEGTRQRVELVSMRPDPTELRNGCRLYRVHVVATGHFLEVIRFVESVSRGHDRLCAGAVVEFAIRSVQGGETVECSLSLASMRLLPESTSRRRLVVLEDAN